MSGMVKTVVVSLDGSELAEIAIPTAVELANLTGADLVLVRVLEEMRPIYDTRRREVIWIDPADSRVELPSPDILEPVISHLAERGLSVHPVVRLGDPREEIIDEARHHPQPVIGMASHGRGGLSRAVFGSVATRILQTAPCPVLLVRPHDTERVPETVTFKRMAVLLDGSMVAEQALPLAVELASEAGAALHLIRVAETYRDELPAETPEFAPPSHESVLEKFEKLEDEARRYLSGVAERVRRDGLQVSWQVLSGDPWRLLVAYTNHERPDLVVLTTHGRSGLTRLFYGSVADKLLTSSEVPILLVRVSDDRQPDDTR